MDFEYTLFDIFDRDKKNPTTRTFKKELQLGDEFVINDVTYRVVILHRHAIVRMMKYKIPNTATQVVHKCPAKKEMLESLTEDDLLKIKDPIQQKELKSSRVKMPGHVVTQCPHCKVTFWKEKDERPVNVEVASIFNSNEENENEHD